MNGRIASLNRTRGRFVPITARYHPANGNCHLGTQRGSLDGLYLPLARAGQVFRVEDLGAGPVCCTGHSSYSSMTAPRPWLCPRRFHRTTRPTHRSSMGTCVTSGGSSTLIVTGVDNCGRTGTSMNNPLPLMSPVFPVARRDPPTRFFHRISTGNSIGTRLLPRC